MPEKRPPNRSVPRAIGCFVMAMGVYAWVAESIVHRRVAFQGSYGRVEHRGIGGVLCGLFLFATGSGVACFGFAYLDPEQSKKLAWRGILLWASAFGFVLLTLLVEGLGWS